MDANDLIKKTNAQRAANRAILNHNGRNVTVARSRDGTMVLTDEGKAIAKELSEKGPAKGRPKTTKPGRRDAEDEPAETPDE